MQKFWEQNKVNLIGWAFILLVVVGIGFLAASGNQKLQQAEISEFTVRAEDHIFGNKDAKVTFIEYADFQCPACAYYEPVIKQLKALKSNDVKFIYRHFPLESIHKNAVASAVASEAASLQGKFDGMYDRLFAGQNDWSSLDNPTDMFVAYAQSLELDVAKFKTDITKAELVAKVRKDLAGGQSVGVDSTPTFYIDGKKVTGLTSGKELERFIKLIDEAAK